MYTRSRTIYHVTRDNYCVHQVKGEIPRHRRQLLSTPRPDEIARHRGQPLSTHRQGGDATTQETTTVYTRSRTIYHVTRDNYCVHQVKGEIPHHKRQLLSTHPHGRDTTSQETTTEYTSPRARLHVTGDNH